MPAVTTSGSHEQGREDAGVAVSGGITPRKVLVFLGYASMFGLAIFTAVALATGLVGHSGGGDKPDDSMSPSDDACRVFCSGDLLREVQLAGIYNDSKSFVDSPLKEDPSAVLAAFAKLPSEPGQAVLRQFVADYFGAPGSDLEDWTPPDYTADPPFLDSIDNATLRAFAKGIHQVWPLLGRRPAPDVAKHPNRHTLLPLPHPVIVPGGRFRESYYWDTYWIVRGLLVSGMRQTAAGLIENFLAMVDRYGFVPNGGRAYYLTRSQPPLLSDMVLVYWNQTGDAAFLQRAVPSLETEYAFWMAQAGSGPHSGSAVELPGGHVLNRYLAFTTLPRPESYVEDVTAAKGKDVKAAAALYRNLASGAATGWDYSSRWFTDVKDIDTIVASRIIPVDLNTYLLRVERNLAAFAQAVGDDKGAARYTAAAEEREKAMHALLWDDEEARWEDLWMDAGESKEVEGVPVEGLRSAGAAMRRLEPAPAASAAPDLAARLAAEAQQEADAARAAAPSGWQGEAAARRVLKGVALSAEALQSGSGGGGPVHPAYPSSFFPLWADLLSGASATEQRRVVQALRDSGLVDVGGVGASTLRTGQQWDWPNAWAPVQWILVQGLRELQVAEAHQLADEIESRWVETALVGYQATGFLFEKYNATDVGDGGGGGEYVPQHGFGWTNGVLLEMLSK